MSDAHARVTELERRVRASPDDLALRRELAAALREVGRGDDADAILQAVAQTKAATIPPIAPMDRTKRPPTIQIPPRRGHTETRGRLPLQDRTPIPELVAPRASQPPPIPIAAPAPAPAPASEPEPEPEPEPEIEDRVTGRLEVISPIASPPATTPPPTKPLDGPFFAPLPADRRDAVLARFYRRTLAPGMLLIRQGETLHPLFLVVKGLLEVRCERASGTVVTLDHARDGEFVGEQALLSHTPSAFQVIAATPVEVLALGPKDFYDIAGAFPALWAFLKDTSERRARDYEARIRRT